MLHDTFLKINKDLCPASWLGLHTRFLPFSDVNHVATSGIIKNRRSISDTTQHHHDSNSLRSQVGNPLPSNQPNRKWWSWGICILSFSVVLSLNSILCLPTETGFVSSFPSCQVRVTRFYVNIQLVFFLRRPSPCRRVVKIIANVIASFPASTSSPASSLARSPASSTQPLWALPKPNTMPG